MNFGHKLKTLHYTLNPTTQNPKPSHPILKVELRVVMLEALSGKTAQIKATK